MKCNEIAHSNEIDVTDHDVFSVVKLYSKLTKRGSQNISFNINQAT